MALTRLCESRPVHLAVLDLYAGNPNLPPSLERVRVLKRRFPRVGLIAYVSSATAKPRDMFDAGRFGLDALIVADVDDAPGALLAHVEKAEARSVASVVLPAVADLRGLVRDAVLASVTRAHEGLTADGLARLLVVPRRSLIRQLSDAGFPAPQQLLIWGRLILAAHLLEDEQRSANGVAPMLDFPSGSAFRNACRRYLGATPGTIRDRGGAAYVIATLMARARTGNPGLDSKGTRQS
jgi:AraC-like DNA-binding protein